MDREGWITLLLYGAYFVYELRTIKQNRRSGRVTDNGHPIRDSVLLLASGLAIAAVLVTVGFFSSARLGRQELDLRLFHYGFDLFVLICAVGLTALSNRLLGKSRKRKFHKNY